MSMPERDTMHRRNNQVIGLALFLLLVSAPFMGTQAQSTPTQAQTPQKISPTPLPPDIDANDPAIPVWARPATPPAAAKPPATATNPANVPSTQPGKTGEPPLSEGSVGQVTRDQSGQFTIRSIVNEVTLSA